MKILNLYAGIGGNRKLWSDEHEITAIEYDENIAAVYNDLYPNDNILIVDAHEYLLNNFKEFDFIWSSPPCPTHSGTNHFLHAQGVIRYPDMKLYEEIIFLQTWYKGKYVVENVKSYYKPLIKPQISGRHYFWSNIKIPNIKYEKQIGRMSGKKSKLGKSQSVIRRNNHYKLGFDISKLKGVDKNKCLNNCVSPEIGLAILNKAINIVNQETVPQGQLF